MSDQEVEVKYREAEMILYLSDLRGIYIPQHFAEGTKRECVTGIKQEDWDVILSGPDNEWYWEEQICNNATVTEFPKAGTVPKSYFIHQDGDCWLVEKGAVWNGEGTDLDNDIECDWVEVG